MTPFAIETTGLRKSFQGAEALRGLDLTVRRGSIFGFLGRNGAGKTTTIRILMGLAKPDHGEAKVLGVTPGDSAEGATIRRLIGFVTEDKELYPYMTVAEIIEFTRPFFRRWRHDLERRYLDLFQLNTSGKIPNLSKGMRSKLMLLLAFCRGADLLVLDEPTDGLDPTAIEIVLRELIALAGSGGTTIFFSPHQLAEVEQVADEIAIIERGRAIVCGGLEDLKQEYRQISVIFAQEVYSDLNWTEGAERVRQEGRMVSVLTRHKVDEIIARAQALPGATVEQRPVTLKEIFLEHTRAT